MRYLSANQFDVFEEIGKGGFGTVYRGIDKVTKKPVAVKQVDLESTDSLDDLQREIRILSECKLSQITQYQGSFVKGYKLWIIMEYLDGGSCADLLVPGPIEEKYIASLLKELLIALCYLHKNSRIHRDVKAANILLNSKGEVKIADFGVSAQLSNNLSRRNTFVGSPYWMPPEVILEEEYNFKADIWSLGITAIELATGKPPLSHVPPMKALFQIPELAPPRLEGDQFSHEFKEFVEICLRKNPSDRPSAKRILKTRFISNASKSNHLIDLITRREEWNKVHEAKFKKREKNFYVSTMIDKNYDNISFDFEDSYSERSNVSSVIITKQSPLKYVSGNSVMKKEEIPPLQENINAINSVNNLNQQKEHLLEFADIKPIRSNLNRDWGTLKLKSQISSETKQTPLKMVFERVFHSTVTKTHRDETEMRKLLAIGEMMKGLKDETLVKFSKEFSQQINRSHAFNENEDDSYRPKIVESEKLLLKRWADQYFI